MFLTEKPLFIIGPGRSGTTLLLRLMALHPELAWRKPHILAAMPLPEQLELYAGRYLGYYQAKKGYRADEDYVQIYYEDLVREPTATLARICDRCELRWDTAVAEGLGSWAITQDTNQAWRQKLPPAQQAYLTRLLARPLQDLGYATAGQ
jgi:LPS sulfotransferase NodH